MWPWKTRGGGSEGERVFQKGGGKCSTQLYPRWMQHDGPFIHPVTGSLQGKAVFCAVISALPKQQTSCVPPWAATPRISLSVEPTGLLGRVGVSCSPFWENQQRAQGQLKAW